MKITCRVCRIQEGEFFTLDSLVSINGEKKHKLLDIYNKSFQLNAVLEDSLPQVVCFLCFGKLKEFYEFKLQGRKSDLEFRESLTDSPIQVAKDNLDNYIVPNLTESKSVQVETQDEITEDELESFQDYEDDNGEEVEDTDILFELYNKNDSCLEKYLKLGKPVSEDYIEEHFDRDDDEIKIPVQETHIVILPLKTPKQTDTNIENGIPTIEISQTESPDSQIQKNCLEPLVETRKFQCVDCGRKYLTEDKLQQHSKLHSESDSCECKICGTHLKSVYDYGEHMKAHSTERKFSCEFCDKTFLSRANLKAHLYIHSNVRPFKCEICEKAFQQKSILKTHMTLHTGKPFECTLCHRRFSRTAHLNIHMRQHNNIRPYQCSQCPCAYMQKSHLDRHISSSHLGVRFQCTICGKMYTKKPSLNTHMRETHCATVSLYSCEVCDLEFAKQKGLYYHLKSKHWSV